MATLEEGARTQRAGWRLWLIGLLPIVALALMMARERVPTELIEQWKEQRDASWDRITAEPATVGVDLSQASWVFDSHVTQQAQIEQDVRSQSLGVRLASAGRV